MKRFAALSAIFLLSVRAVFAQFGPPPLPPPPPSLDQIKAEAKLTDEQAAQLKPLLEEAAKARADAAAAQEKLTALQAQFLSEAGAALTDEQRGKLPQAMFRAQFGGPPGPRPSGGQAPAAAAFDQPEPRTDAGSMETHTQLLAKRKQGKIDAYFLGDSIIRRWGATDYPDFLAHWNKSFHGWNAADFGRGADTLQNMIWRLDNGELDEVNPKVIVFLGGTNNIGGQPGDDTKAEAIARGVKAVLDRFRQKAPGATVILTGIFPRGNDPKLHAFIRGINTRISKYADGKQVRWLDISDKLATPEGRLVDGVMGDGLHLSLKGYEIWASALKPLLTEILGPPAAEDQAPPATGPLKK